MTNIFVILLFVLFSISVIRAINKIGSFCTTDTEGKLNTLKDYVLCKNVSCKKTSFAATSLLVSSYFLIHLLPNKGENYNDSLQAESYQKSLTSKNLEVIDSVERNYEQYCL